MSASRRTRRALLLLAAVPVAVVGLGLLLPRSWEVERRVAIDAPAAAVHARLADLRTWSDWAPWPPGRGESDASGEASAEGEPRFSGPERGVDATATWSGPDGSGALVLTACDPELGVWFDLELAGGRLRAKGALRYAPVGEGARPGAGVQVVGSLRGRLGGNPAARWLGPLLERRFGRRLEDALAALARACGTAER